MLLLVLEKMDGGDRESKDSGHKVASGVCVLGLQLSSEMEAGLSFVQSEQNHGNWLWLGVCWIWLTHTPIAKMLGAVSAGGRLVTATVRTFTPQKLANALNKGCAPLHVGLHVCAVTEHLISLFV